MGHLIVSVWTMTDSLRLFLFDSLIDVLTGVITYFFGLLNIYLHWLLSNSYSTVYNHLVRASRSTAWYSFGLSTLIFGVCQTCAFDFADSPLSWLRLSWSIGCLLYIKRPHNFVVLPLYILLDLRCLRRGCSSSVLIIVAILTVLSEVERVGLQMTGAPCNFALLVEISHHVGKMRIIFFTCALDRGGYTGDNLGGHMVWLRLWINIKIKMGTYVVSISGVCWQVLHHTCRVVVRTTSGR